VTAAGGRGGAVGCMVEKNFKIFPNKARKRNCDIFKVLNKLICLIIIFTLKTFNPEYQINLTGFPWMYEIGKNVLFTTVFG